MFENFKKFIEKIQNSDENIKKRWLIISSAIIMILIISLWLVYMNWMINSFDKPPEKQELGTNFWQILRNGLNVVTESIWNNIKTFFQKITRERIIEIK